MWKILVWRIITNSLSVGENFARRGMGVATVCKMCNNGSMVMETMEHLFRDCPVSRRLRASSDIGISASNGSHLPVGKWIIDRIYYLDKQECSAERVVRFLATIWCLWSIRNRVLFQASTFHPKMFFNQWNQIVATADKALETNKSGSTSNGSIGLGRQDDQFLWVCESKPICVVGSISFCDHLRIMVDAGWKTIDNAGIGWVVLSSTGEVIFTARRSIRAESALQEEGLGIYEALQWAVDRGFRHLEVSSDCLTLICSLAGIQRPHHCLADILADVDVIASFFHCLAFSYIPRSYNKIAHDLACEAMSS
ncbi:uncharacterized protein LOC141655648 [Silene latifolia]|uniref:uncharacterized protein LOC141655648 n=1 Tax=Silene latifolia TaxID=37657 RepID=UPI003D777E4B